MGNRINWQASQNDCLCLKKIRYPCEGLENQIDFKLKFFLKKSYFFCHSKIKKLLRMQFLVDFKKFKWCIYLHHYRINSKPKVKDSGTSWEISKNYQFFPLGEKKCRRRKLSSSPYRTRHLKSYGPVISWLLKGTRSQQRPSTKTINLRSLSSPKAVLPRRNQDISIFVFSSSKIASTLVKWK